MCECSKLKLSGKREAQAMVTFLRSAAIEWMRAHADAIIWDGMPLKLLALSMSTFEGTFPDYLEHLRIRDQWIDACVLHALACKFSLDVAVWQAEADPCLVGISLMPEAADMKSVPLVSVAMVNDKHFWGIVNMEEQVKPVDRGDCFPPTWPPSAPPGSDAKRASNQDDFDQDRYYISLGCAQFPHIYSIALDSPETSRSLMFAISFLIIIKRKWNET